MKLTYWYCECHDDSDVYSVRVRTRKEAVAKLAEINDPPAYHPPVKVSVEFSDSFDLMLRCSSAGHHFWEKKA